MKITNILGCSLGLVALVAMGACGQKSDDKGQRVTERPRKSSVISFVSFADTAIVDLPWEDVAVKETPYYGYIYHSGVFPVSDDDNDISELQDSLMLLAFNTKAPTIQEAINHAVAHTSLLSNENATAKLASMPLKRDSITSEQSCVISLQTKTDDILSLAVTQFSYIYLSAHGNTGTIYLNYYIPTGQVLTVDKVFNEQYRTQIIGAIRDAAREQYSDNESISPDEIERYDNFYITTDGKLVFVYGQYEIAPYVCGEVKVEVEPYAICDYLTPTGKEIFGI